MSLPLAAKIGAAGTLVAGVPATYFVWDKYFSLNEVEKSVIDENVEFTITAEDKGAKVEATTKVKVPNSTNTSATYKWECKITSDDVESGNKDKFKTYLEGKLPTTTSPEPKKTKNKEKLVRECSKNRQDLDTGSNTYKSILKLKVTSPGDDNISTELFGSKNTASD